MNRPTHEREGPDVTASIPDNPGHVIITCAECGASEIAEAEILADAPVIVCRKCGETWPAPGHDAAHAAADGRALRLLSDSSRAAPPAPFSHRHSLEAARRPLVTYHDRAEDAWLAKAAADRDPPVVARSRIPRLAAALASALFLGAFLFGREAAVTAIPDLAGLYAAIGLPVNLDGFAIRGLEAERGVAGDTATLVVRGRIENVSAIARAVPPLVVGFRDAAQSPAGIRSFDPPARKIAPGEAAPFEVTLLAIPPQAGEIVVRLRRPGAGGAPI